MEGLTSIPLFAANLSGAQVLFLGLLLATTASLLFRAHRRLAHSATVDRARFPAQLPANARAARGVDSLAGVANHFEVRLHDSLREAQGRLDTKIAALNQLIVDADRESSRLEALLERLQATVPTEAQSPGMRRLDHAGGAEVRALASPRGNGLRPAAENPNHKNIYALADAGLDAPGIARRVGSGLGEIELILGLRNKGS